MLCRDEIEDAQMLLVPVEAQSATQLLQKHRQTLRRTQKNHRVHEGQIHPFIEEINRKNHIDLAALQLAPGLAPQLSFTLARQRQRRQPAAIAELGHERRMTHTHAEAQRPHAPRLLHVPQQLMQHPARALLIVLQKRAQLRPVVAARAPRQPREIHARLIIQPEIEKGTQQPRRNRIRQAQLVRDAPAEERQNILPVHALRRRRQPQQTERAQALERLHVARRRAVVGLIDHHIAEGSR